MIKQRFVLDEAARSYLDLTARKKWYEVQLSVRGAALGPPLSRVELRDGQTYRLADGSELLVQLASPLFMPFLRIERDGVAVPGSEGSGEGRSEVAGGWLIGLGLLTGLFGLLAPASLVAAKTAAYLTAVFFMVTGFFARRGSYPALLLGSGLFLLSVLSDIRTSTLPQILIQLLFLIPMYRAVRAQYGERKGVARPLRRTDVPLAVVKSVVRPPSEFAATIAPSSKPLVVADEAIASSASVRAVSQAMPAASPQAGAWVGPTAAQEGAVGSDRKFGSYLVSEILGSGAMATVYRARQTSVGRDVALKVITGSQAADPEFLERFRREAETTAGLSHPHILKVFDYGEDGGRPYLAMEYMGGGTLRGRITGAQLPLPQVLKWAEQIGQAMNSAHSQGVVHRDIKPENVLLDKDANAFLADFGLARLADARGNLTQTGTQMGSPSYMAPEQWHGADVTAAADLYAFAVMLFELLCGRPPFVADTLPALMTQHLRGKVPPLPEFRPGLPPALDAFFTRALSKSPSLRFENAATLVAAFQASLASTPRSAPTAAIEPSRVPPPRVSPSRISPPRVAAPARVVPKAVQPARSNNVRFWVGLAAVVLIAGGGLQAYRQSTARKGTDPQGPTAPAPANATAPVAAVTMTGSMHPLEFRPRVVKFSKSLNLIVATVDDKRQLMIIDPATSRFDQVQLSAQASDVCVSPDGLTAAVMHYSESRVSVVNLATRAVERIVSVPGMSGDLATTGTWVYMLPRNTDSRVRSINLATEDIQIGRDKLPTGVFLLHPSGRRAYDLAPEESPPVRRLEIPMGPLAEVLPVEVPSLEVTDSRGGFWFSERGDYLFTSRGQAFSVTDDPLTDVTAIGRFGGFEHTREHIVSLSHSEAAGRVVTATSENVYGSSEFVTTYRFPGFQQVAHEPVPALGSAAHPARSNVMFVATSIDGRWVYAVAEAREQTDGAVAGVFVGPLR